MRSTKPISASDALPWGSDQQGFPKNRHACFGKHSFQPHTSCRTEYHAQKMTVFSIVTAAFFRNNVLGANQGKYARYPVRRYIMRSSVGGSYLRRYRGSPARVYEMRSTETISAPDAISRGSGRHSFPKNRQGCFGKRSFQPHLVYLMPFHTLKMTVFSIVTATFFPKHGQGPGRDPGNNRYSDNAGEPPPREDSPVLGRNPGYRMLPTP